MWCRDVPDAGAAAGRDSGVRGGIEHARRRRRAAVGPVIAGGRKNGNAEHAASWKVVLTASMAACVHVNPPYDSFSGQPQLIDSTEGAIGGIVNRGGYGIHPTLFCPGRKVHRDLCAGATDRPR